MADAAAGRGAVCLPRALKRAAAPGGCRSRARRAGAAAVLGAAAWAAAGPAFWHPVVAERGAATIGAQVPAVAPRRGFLAAATAALAARGRPVSAKVLIPQKDVERLQEGYSNIQYLLANWEKETTNSRGDRDSNAVRQYLGLKSTLDPLFKIEQVLTKVTSDIEPDMQEEYQEALEKWGFAIDYGNTDSYISAFGEYNPGGGKATVLKYLERAKESVVTAKNSIEVFGKALNLNLDAKPVAMRKSRTEAGGSFAR